MKETDIRPSELIKGQEKAFQHDIDRLSEYYEEFVVVDCPACGDDGLRNIVYEFDKPFLFFYYRCPKCDTVYINPRPTPELLEDYYKNSEHYRYWASKIFPQTEKKRKAQIFTPRARKVVEIAQRYKVRGYLLDIGAGYGTFCQSIRSRRYFRVISAVEPNPELAQICRENGILTNHRPIEESLLKNCVNCITAFELIEHLYSPQDFIKKCYEILTKNGLLILTCPNVQGFDIAVLKENSDQFNPEHLNYFNPKSLSLLLENNGFEVLEISTPGKLDVDIVKNKIAQKKYTPEPFIQALLDTGDKFQQFLQDNNLSSHLWMVARKE